MNTEVQQLCRISSNKYYFHRVWLKIRPGNGSSTHNVQYLYPKSIKGHLYSYLYLLPHKYENVQCTRWLTGNWQLICAIYMPKVGDIDR